MILKDRFFDEDIQQFLSLLHDPQFRRIAEALNSYDIRMSGNMVFPQDSEEED